MSCGDPGIVSVRFYNRKRLQNVATFEFEYIDDRIPEVEDASPFQVYCDGGYEVRVIVIKFSEDTTREAVSIEVQDSSSGLSIGDPFKPK